jgi:hypothetical protein
MEQESYNTILSNNYDIIEEKNKYLFKDLISLYEVMEKFADMVYLKFGINLAQIKTASSLSLSIYTSNYYKLKYNIPILKG